MVLNELRCTFHAGVFQGAYSQITFGRGWYMVAMAMVLGWGGGLQL